VLSASTYLRDIFDATNETATGVVPTCPSCAFTDDSTAPLYMIVDALAAIPNGTGSGQIDEPWNSNYTAVTEQDGRGVVTFMSRFGPISGQTDSNERRMNCNTP
jgi:hypothetical protein